MACEVCEHCNTAVCREEARVQEGYSYHERCHKCYVCSETDLQDADVFKGVIFCSGCSDRIFQGCSTARRGVKNVRARRSQRPEYKEYKEREKRRFDMGYNKYANQVLQRACLNAAGSTSTNPSTVATALTNQTYQMTKPCQLAKNSKGKYYVICGKEIGTTTNVTKELLKHIISPIDIESKAATPAKPQKKRKSKREKIFKKNYCSDPRIAALGTSTEIAHMALRRQSEVPVIIKSETRLKRKATQSLFNLTQESDSTDGADSSQGSSPECARIPRKTLVFVLSIYISGDGDPILSRYSESSSPVIDSGHWKNRTIGSLIKLPYKSFKRNILDRSSLISVIIKSSESECILYRFRALFRHEITEHQRRGLKRLFSTINRRKEQYKLGWLDVMNKIPEDERLNIIEKREKRCHHYKRSHSFRCMRAQVMKLAGPTKSELAVLRKKLKNAFCLNLCKGLRDFNNQHVKILKSVVCDKSRPQAGILRITSGDSRYNSKS